jgi:hypothetical protein
MAHEDVWQYIQSKTALLRNNHRRVEWCTGCLDYSSHQRSRGRTDQRHSVLTLSSAMRYNIVMRSTNCAYLLDVNLNQFFGLKSSIDRPEPLDMSLTITIWNFFRPPFSSCSLVDRFNLRDLPVHSEGIHLQVLLSLFMESIAETKEHPSIWLGSVAPANFILLYMYENLKSYMLRILSRV